MDIASILDIKFKGWKDALLDLSLRNRLLNAKTGKSIVDITEPAPDALLSALHGHGPTSLVIMGQPNASDERNGQTGPQRTPRPGRSNRGHVRVDVHEDEVWRRLRYIDQRRKTAKSEQGVHVLYVAFGALTWMADGQPGRGPFRAPLYLVPVELNMDSRNGGIRLSRSEGESRGNEALRLKLQREFAITLPPLSTADADDDRPPDLLPYFQGVREAVSRQNGWHVDASCMLGIFSFARIALYEDLDNYRGDLADHPFLRLLAGDAGALNGAPLHRAAGVADGPGGATDFRNEAGSTSRPVAPVLTDIVPRFAVVDLDHSQEEAVVAAREGQSFVVQGPPGTGKSQTIVNILAECLGAGKRVLFVSQKQAAIDVVYERLHSRGLDRFCLNLHSPGTDKKALIELLRHALDDVQASAAQGHGNGTVVADLQRRLDASRVRLDSYVAALHAPRSAASWSAYEVAARLATAITAPVVTFPYKRIWSMTPTDWGAIEDWLRTLQSLAAVWDAQRNHPWRGLSHPALGDADRARVMAVLQAAAEAGRAARTHADHLADVLGVRRPVYRTELPVLVALASCVATTPRPPAGWLEHPDARLGGVAAQWEARFQAERERRNVLARHFTDAVLDLPAAELEATLEKTLTLPALRQSIDLTALWEPAARELDALAGHARATLAAATVLAQRLGFPEPRSVEDASRLVHVAKAMRRDPRPLGSWLEWAQLLEIRARLQRRVQERERLHALRARLATVMAPGAIAALSEEWIREMRSRFENEYRSLWNRFSSRFRNDMREVRTHLRPTGRLDRARTLATLRDLTACFDIEGTWRAALVEDAQSLGSRVRGAETDWAAILAAVEATMEVIDAADGNLPEPAKLLLLQGGPVLAEALRPAVELESHLDRVRQSGQACEAYWTLGGSDLNGLATAGPAWSAELRTFGDALRMVGACLSPAAEMPTCDRLRELLGLARESREWSEALSRADGDLRSTFGHLFQGPDTNWASVRHALEWARQFRAEIDHYGTVLGERLLEWTVGERCDPASGIAPLRGNLEESVEDLNRRAEEWAALFDADSPFGREGAEGLRLDAWISELEGRVHATAELRNWGLFQGWREEGRSLGLAAFITEAERRRLPAASLRPVLFRHLLTLWLDQAAREDQVLSLVQSTGQDDAVDRFQRCDRELLDVAAQELVTTVRKRQTMLVESSSDLSLPQRHALMNLRREVGKRRHRSLRRILAETADAALVLCPCVLASPLTVAQFFEPRKAHFDVLVFDEASQICTEEAVSAVLRSNQVIVCGDEHQLPPTRFFWASGAEDDSDDDDSMQSEGAEQLPVSAFGSLLEECIAADISRRPLLWHYRSRHEALISFSNEHIYNGRLITFPCPHDPAVCAAIEMHHLTEATYDRGGSRQNRREAEHVVALLERLARQSPDAAVGIVAFSQAQEEAIQEVLDAHLRSSASQSLRDLIQKRDESGYFLKNLETVQGDEIETVILSVGYGRDRGGRLHYNFGPLTHDGGHRRLNVAVTRARDRVHVVCSVSGSDLADARSRGVQLLGEYLRWAEKGRAAGSPDGTPSGPGDPLATAIASELRQRGYTVAEGVGRSDYRVAVAVLDPESRTAVLGIETDGPFYRNARSTRERDRLRAEVLYGLRWRLHRVWSLAWIRDHEREIPRMLDAIAEAAREQGLSSEHLLGGTRATPPKSVKPQNGPLSRPGPIAEKAESEASRDQAPAPGLSPVNGAHAPTPPAPAPYVPARLGNRSSGRGIDREALRQLALAVGDVVKVEGPVSEALVIRRVAEAWRAMPSTKVTLKVRDAIAMAVDGGFARQGDGFLWPPRDPSPLRPRTPADGAAARSPGDIAPREAAAAIVWCLHTGGAQPFADLHRAVAELFKIRPDDSALKDLVVRALRILRDDGRVVEAGAGIWQLRRASDSDVV